VALRMLPAIRPSLGDTNGSETITPLDLLWNIEPASSPQTVSYT
jgi:hypothetical protein